MCDNTHVKCKMLVINVALLLLIDQVVWKRLYDGSSVMDSGSLFQLRTLINRRNVVSDVSKDLTACEEFMELVTVGHVLAAAIHIAGAADIAGLSTNILSPGNSPMMNIISITKTLCHQMVTLVFTKDASKARSSSNDHVMEYAKETLSLGLLLLEFKDAVREGDGNRVLRCWKFFFLIFHATQHKNYCLEAFNLLMQYYYVLPPRYAQQMLWGRFINSEGKPGHNISADLHMEHLNRLLKGTISHLSANKTPQAIERAGKVLGVLNDILIEFDQSTGGHASSMHTIRSEAEDLIKVVTELSEKRVFNYESGRKHKTFPSIECNTLLKRIKEEKLQKWMTTNASKILKCSYLCR